MKRRIDRPGAFLYAGGMVFEVDNCGKRHPRKDIGPGVKMKHKFFSTKKACRR